MADHYYTASPTSEHRPLSFRVEILGNQLAFETDSGVFSRTELDTGSRLLIETVHPIEGDALDLGCGWGAVGISLLSANPGVRFVFTDVNERATELVRRNAQRNGLGAVEVVSGDGFSALSGRLFDHVLLNPPIRAGKAVIYRLFDDSYRHLKPGGALTIVIRKQQGAPSAAKHLEGVFQSVETIGRGHGFHVIRATKGERE